MSPCLPSATRNIRSSARTIAVRPGAEADTPIDPDATVLILGTGLSMVDAWISLAARGHRGRIDRAVAARPDLLDPPQGQADPAGFGRRAARHRPLLFRALVPRPGARDRARRRRLARRRRRHPAVQPADLAKLAGQRAAPLHRAHARLVGRAPPPHAAGAARARFARGRRRRAGAGRRQAGRRQRATATASPRRSAGAARPRPRRFTSPASTIAPASPAISRAGSNPIVRSLIDRGLARPDPLRIGLDVTEACAIVKARRPAVGTALRDRAADARRLLRDRRDPRHPHAMRDAGAQPDRARRPGGPGGIAAKLPLIRFYLLPLSGRRWIGSDSFANRRMTGC